jgi:hypothetical protein
MSDELVGEQMSKAKDSVSEFQRQTSAEQAASVSHEPCRRANWEALKDFLRPALVDMSSLDPTVRLATRYARKNNF